MTRKKKFSQEELNGHVEMISIYWHRHGDEEEHELVEYLKALYEAVPASRKTGPVSTEAGPVSIDLAELDQLLYAALNPPFDEDEVAEELWSFVAALESAGGKRSSENVLTVDVGILRDRFELQFGAHVLNGELVEKLQIVREFLTI